MAGKQLEFDFQRAPKLWMIEHLARVPCDCTAQGKRWCNCWNAVKSVLKAVDGFAHEAPHCTVTVKSLALSMGKGVTAAKQAIRIAAQLGYILVLSADEASGLDTERQRSGSMSTYKVDWLKIWYETEEAAPQRIRAKVGTSVPAPVARAKSDHVTPRNPTTFPAKSDHVPPEIRPRPLRNPTTPPSKSDHVTLEIRPPVPPPPLTPNAPNTAVIAKSACEREDDDGDDGGEDSWKAEDQEQSLTSEDVVELLEDAGVRMAWSAVDAALDNAMPLEAVAAIARHVLKHPGCYAPAAIYTTITSRDAIRKAPEDALKWCRKPGSSSSQAPTTGLTDVSTRKVSDLENVFGKILDAMPAQELRSLVSLVPGRQSDRNRLLAKIDDPDGVLKSSLYRGMLLEALHRRRQRDGPSATLPTA